MIDSCIVRNIIEKWLRWGALPIRESPRGNISFSASVLCSLCFRERDLNEHISFLVHINYKISPRASAARRCMPNSHASFQGFFSVIAEWCEALSPREIFKNFGETPKLWIFGSFCFLRWERSIEWIFSVPMGCFRIV